MRFCEAITLLIHGSVLTRGCWNKGGVVYQTDEHHEDNPPSRYFRYEDHGSVRTWSANWDDMTAEDWDVMPQIPNIYYKQDGDKICAFRSDFIDLQQSIAGFGCTRRQAAADLLQEEGKHLVARSEPVK